MVELKPHFRFRVAEPPPLAATHPVDGRIADADGVVPKNRMTWTRARSLADMQERFAFFTPAILYLYGGFRDQMLADFAARHPDLEVWWGFTLFDQPLFRGLVAPDGDDAWNHALWCVPIETYKRLRPYLASVALSYEPTRWFAETGVRPVVIPDPIRRVTSMTVDVFGFSATDGTLYMKEGPLPTLAKAPPSRDVGVFREAILEGENPLLAVEIDELARRHGDS